MSGDFSVSYVLTWVRVGVRRLLQTTHSDAGARRRIPKPGVLRKELISRISYWLGSNTPTHRRDLDVRIEFSSGLPAQSISHCSVIMASPTEDDKDELLLACRYGDLEDVQHFVDQFGPGRVAEVVDSNGNTVIHMAAGNGHQGEQMIHLGLTNTTSDIHKEPHRCS